MRKNAIWSALLMCAVAASGVLEPATARAQVVDDSVLIASSHADAPLVPDVSAVDLSGRSWSLRSLRGYPVILSLCATWCPASRDQMKHLGTLQKKLGPSGVVILAISTEDRATLTDYARRSGSRVPLLTDDGTLTATLGAPAYPTAFFIGRQGRILARTVGSSPEIVKLFETLIEADRTASARQQSALARGSQRGATQRAQSKQLRRNAPAKNQKLAKAAGKRASAKKPTPAREDDVLLLDSSGTHVLR